MYASWSAYEATAHSCFFLFGEITDPRRITANDKYPYLKRENDIIEISGENRKMTHVWNYSDINNFNTDQMFAGNLTYDILSSDPDAIRPHLFAGLDENFTGSVEEGDVIVGGENFGCGSS